MERETRSQHIAAEVRATLARNQISGKQLAAHLGISQFAVSRRLRGETPFSVDELSATADFLAVSLEELLATKAA